MAHVDPDKDLLHKIELLDKFKAELYALMDKYGVSFIQTNEVDEFNVVSKEMYPMIQYHIFGESIREILNNKDV
jgi:hypothetical protein